MNLKWLTEYMIIAHSLPYNVVVTFLHHIVSNETHIGWTICDHVQKCIQECNWEYCGTQTATFAFQNKAIASEFQHAKGAHLVYKYPGKVICFGVIQGVFFLHIRDVVFTADNQSLDMSNKRVSPETFFTEINKIFRA